MVNRVGARVGLGRPILLVTALAAGVVGGRAGAAARQGTGDAGSVAEAPAAAAAVSQPSPAGGVQTSTPPSGGPYRIVITEYTKVFAPCLSGSAATCQVTYRISPAAPSTKAGPGPASVALQVHKLGVSRAVFTKLYSPAEVTRLDGHTYRLRWDGRKDGGYRAGGGRYRFRVKQFASDGTWSVAETPRDVPMQMVHVGITQMLFTDYDAKDPTRRVYRLMFNERSETDPADVKIDVEWRVPDIYTAEAPPSNVYSGRPDWHNWPVCYMKGGKLRAMIKTDGDGYGPGSGVQIKIASPDCIPVPGEGDEDDIAPSNWYGLQTASDRSLPTTVNKHAAFPVPIKFYYLRKGREYLLGTQRTTHVLYTVNAPPGPLAKAANGRIYVTVVDTSCRLVGGSAQIFGSIWAGLWDLRMDVPGGSKPLMFAHLVPGRGYEVSDLLDPDVSNGSKHWGRCGAWGLFQAALLAVQGEPVSVHAIFPKASLGIDSLFVRDGLVARNNPDPLVEFDGHSLTKYRGRWYDPTYHMPKSGRGFASLHDWEQAGIKAYNYRHRGPRGNDPKKVEVEEGPKWSLKMSEATLPGSQSDRHPSRGGVP